MRISALLTCATLAAITALTATQARASTVVYAGSLVDTASSWRTPSAANNVFALNPSGVLGSDGYVFPGGQGVSSVPAYVTSFTSVGAVYPGNGSYASIDNPTTTPGASPTQFVTGTFNPFPGTGNAATTVSLTLGASAPGKIRLGVLVDNLDGTVYNSSAVQVTSSLGGGSALVNLSSASFNNRLADFVYFDILGGVAGETFSVVNFGGAAGCACEGGVSFDSTTAVPEPATLALLAAGFGLVGVAARRRRVIATA